jgi:hypothetical protein
MCFDAINLNRSYGEEHDADQVDDRWKRKNFKKRPQRKDRLKEKLWDELTGRDK